MIFCLPSHSQNPPRMSQSQASFYSDSLLDPDLLQSDDLPDLPSSHPTVTSIPNSNFTFPLQYSPRAPDSLERVGPTLRKFWILYNSNFEMEHSRSQFVEWWLKTGFGSNKDVREHLHWDGKKKSDLWESYEQVAHEKTGEPKVMCKRCYTVLTHPNHKRGGTSALKAHLKGGACLIHKKRRGIDQLIRDAVSTDYSLPRFSRTDILILLSRVCQPVGYSTRISSRIRFSNLLRPPDSRFVSLNTQSLKIC